MLIYFFIIIFWLSILFLLKLYEETNRLKVKNNSKVYFWIAGISLVLVMGLRHVSVGSDTIRYQFHYYFNTYRPAEPLYSYFTRFFNDLGIPFQLFLFIHAFIIVMSITLLYYKYSKKVMLSYFLYLTIGLFTMSMTGIRQTLAVSLTIFAFIALMNNKNISFFLLCITAYFIHNSAIIFLIVFFFRKINLNRKKASVIYLISILTLISKKYLVDIILYFVPNRYETYLEGDAYINPMVIIVSAAIPLASLIFWPNNEDKKEANIFSMFFFMSCVNLVINILASDVNLIERMTYYFIIYITVLIPNVVQQIKQKDYRLIAYFASIIFPLIQFTLATPGGSLGIDNYSFFWN